MGEWIAFGALAGTIIMCALFVVLGRNPVGCAIALVIKLFALAGMYGVIGADFLAAIQVIIYAGAIMVLFTFVIMLLNVPPDSRSRWDRPPVEFLMVGLSVLALFGVGIYLIFGAFAGEGVEVLTRSLVTEQGGNTLMIGRLLFSKYVWPFELASILILMAIIASIVIAKKYNTEES